MTCADKAAYNLKELVEKQRAEIEGLQEENSQLQSLISHQRAKIVKLIDELIDELVEKGKK